MTEQQHDEQETKERPVWSSRGLLATVLTHARLRRQPRTFYAASGVDATASGRRSNRRSSCALRATTIVETLIRMAPTAGGRTMPIEARMPAASGIATTL